MTPDLHVACRSWGEPFGTAGYADDPAALSITSSGTVPSLGGCASQDVDFLPGGVFVEVLAVPVNGYAAFGSLDPGEPSLTIQDGSIELADAMHDIEIRPYDPVAMRWLRLRPDRAADTSIADVSPDGVHWTRLADTRVTPPCRVRIQLVGRFASSDPDVARFANLNICQPGTQVVTSAPEPQCIGVP
jgi:hypothetical protein